MGKKRIVEYLPILPDEICHIFGYWCVFEQAKPATIECLRQDGLNELAQMITEAGDYSSLFTTAKRVSKIIDEMWTDIKAILNQPKRVQAYRSSHALSSAARFALEDTFKNMNIAEFAKAAIATDDQSQRLCWDQQDQKLAEICTQLGIDVEQLLHQSDSNLHGGPE